MSIFFDGRVITSPAVVSAVDDSAMANLNANVGNTLVLVGRSVGGQPNTPLSFGSAAEAAAVLIGGDLLSAAKRAFDASSETGAPQTIICIRVDPATQSSLVLNDAGAAPVITLASTDYGQRTQQVKVKVEAGSLKGRKLTTALASETYSEDNVYRDAFSIQYTGAQASAVMTVSNTQVILQAPTGTTVATIDLATYATVQQLVDRINAVVGFGASVLDGNEQRATLNSLDSVTAQDVRTAAYTATAHLQAIVDWFNSTAEGFVTATRAANIGTMPAAIPFTYLSGGDNGSVTNTEWSNAFTVLQSVDCQWVVPLSSDPSIHAMVEAHVEFMSGVAQKERRAIVGTALATSDTDAIAAAKALNNDRLSLVHLGGYDYNAAGALTLYAPYIIAAMVAGAFAGVSPGTPLTNKSLKLRGLERKLRNPTDTDALIRGGVLALEETPTGYRVVKSITTWLTNQNYNRVEVSTGVAVDYTARALREGLASIKGAKGNPATLGLAISSADTVLRGLAVAEPNGPGVLAGDADNPPFKNLTAKLVGDRIAVSVQVSPVIPVNYVTITIYAVPFSGTASA